MTSIAEARILGYNALPSSVSYNAGDSSVSFNATLATTALLAVQVTACNDCGAASILDLVQVGTVSTGSSPASFRF